MKRTGWQAHQIAVVRNYGRVNGFLEVGTGERKGSLVEKAIADDIIEAKDSSRPASNIAQALGIPFYGLRQMTAGDPIQPVRRRVFDILQLEPRFSVRDYEHVVSKLAKSTRKQPADGATLSQLMLHFGGREKPWKMVIRKLIDGDLTFHRLGKTSKQRVIDVRTNLIVSRQQFFLQSWDDNEYHQSEERTCSHETEYSIADTLELLCCTFKNLAAAERHGDLKKMKVPHRRGMVYDRDQVLQMLIGRVYLAEIGFRLGFNDLRARLRICWRHTGWRPA